MLLLIEDVVVQWLHADPRRVSDIRDSHDNKVFELECVEAVSWMHFTHLIKYIYIYILRLPPVNTSGHHCSNFQHRMFVVLSHYPPQGLPNKHVI